MKKLAYIGLIAISLYGDIFVKGKSDIGLSVGAATSFGQTYTVVGVSGNYFFIDNMSFTGYYRGWFGASPTQHEFSLGTNYYIPISHTIRPYAGVFFRESIIDGEGYDNFSAYGARGGVSIVNGKNSYMSIGYAYEEYSQCNYGECSNSYPEIIFGLSF